MKVLGSDETFRINLIDLFGSRGAGCKPAVFGADFKSSNGGSVGRCAGEFGGDGFAGEDFGRDIFWHECGELLFFFAGGGCIDSCIVGGSMALRHGGVMVPGILVGCGTNFSGKEGEDDAVFIGTPNGAIMPP